MAWLHFRNQRTCKSPAILVTHRIIALLSLHLLWSLSLNLPHQPLLKSESHSNTIPIICLVPFQYYSHCLPGLIPRLSHYLVSFPDCPLVCHTILTMKLDQYVVHIFDCNLHSLPLGSLLKNGWKRESELAYAFHVQSSTNYMKMIWVQPHSQTTLLGMRLSYSGCNLIPRPPSWEWGYLTMDATSFPAHPPVNEVI